MKTDLNAVGIPVLQGGEEVNRVLSILVLLIVLLGMFVSASRIVDIFLHDLRDKIIAVCGFFVGAVVVLAFRCRLVE